MVEMQVDVYVWAEILHGFFFTIFVQIGFCGGKLELLSKIFWFYGISALGM